MAGEDGYVRIGTKIDTSGIDDGLGQVDKKLKGGTKGLSEMAGGFAKVGVAAGAAAVVLKKGLEIVKDLTDAYKKQTRAETQLEAAAKNNPYLDDASVRALKGYASELQKVAAVGDEELLPYMAQLATAGRTQAEIQEIMQVALDASASGAMSLDSAVRNLNKTYGGLAGELGETVPELRNLTSEEMKQGGAVKLLGERYKGMAAEVAKNTGSADKLKNAMGDLKEGLGAPFEKAIAPAREYFAAVVQGWADSMAKKREYDQMFADAESDVKAAAKLTVDTWEETFDTTDAASKQAAAALNMTLSPALDKVGKNYTLIMRTIDGMQEQVGLSTRQILALNDAYNIFNPTVTETIRLGRLEESTRLGGAEARAAAKKATDEDLKKKEEEKKKLEALNKYIAENTAARNAAIQRIRAQAAAEGEEVDNMEILNAYVSSYVSLIAESGGRINENSGAAKNLLATIKKLADEWGRVTESEQQAKDEAAKLADKMKAALDAIEEDRPESVKMKERMDALDALYRATIDNAQITADDKAAIDREYAEKREILTKQIAEVEKQEAEEAVRVRREKTAEMMDIVSQFALQYQQIMQSLQSLVTQQIEDEATIKTAELEKQYQSGEISAEEYEERLTEIKREAAKEKYRIDMWAWSANIAAAISNTALAATKALADGGGWVGPVLAASIIALGGVQLASLIASKPIPPTFATGGIVPGTSYTGDKVESLLNSREMVLNAGQQRNLFDRINSGDLGGGGTNVQIYNSAANIVKAEPTVDERGIRIAIRQTVSKDMSDGKFNTPMRKAQQNMRGTRYTT